MNASRRRDTQCCQELGIFFGEIQDIVNISSFNRELLALRKSLEASLKEGKCLLDRALNLSGTIKLSKGQIAIFQGINRDAEYISSLAEQGLIIDSEVDPNALYLITEKTRSIIKKRVGFRFLMDDELAREDWYIKHLTQRVFALRRAAGISANPNTQRISNKLINEILKEISSHSQFNIIKSSEWTEIKIGKSHKIGDLEDICPESGLKKETAELITSFLSLNSQILPLFGRDLILDGVNYPCINDDLKILYSLEYARIIHSKCITEFRGICGF